jgi:predicted enzyme related to lactoylglutathione lyase
MTSPIARPLAVAFDCHDPARLLAFWQKMLGGTQAPEPHEDDFMVLEDVPVFGYLGFQKVPEGKVVKNRVHLDLDVDDIDAAVAASTAIGATIFGGVVEEPTNWFQVMQDPEGNEFCFILRKSRLST